MSLPTAQALYPIKVGGTIQHVLDHDFACITNKLGQPPHTCPIQLLRFTVKE